MEKLRLCEVRCNETEKLESKPIIIAKGYRELVEEVNEKIDENRIRFYLDKPINLA